MRWRAAASGAGKRRRPKRAALFATALAGLASLATSEPRIEVKAGFEHTVTLSKSTPSLDFRFTAHSPRVIDLSIAVTGRWRGAGPPTPVIVRLEPDDPALPTMERRIFADRDAAAGTVPQGTLTDRFTNICNGCRARYEVELILDGPPREVEVEWSTLITSHVPKRERKKVGIALDMP